MRTAFVVVALASALTTTFAQLPSCATSCLTQAKLGSCKDITDIPCLCTNQEFITSLAGCIQSSCPASDIANAMTGAQSLCQSAGVSLSLPSDLSTGAGSATSGASSGSTSATGSASVTASGSASQTSAPSASGTASGGNGAAAHGVGALAGLVVLAMGAAL